MNYYDVKETVQNLVKHIDELDKKVKYLDTKATILSEIQDSLMRKIDVLEAEAYDADKVKSAIREIREHLQDNSDFWAYVKLEESQ